MLLRVQILTLTKSQIDRLGDRLKNAPPTDADLNELHEYRSTFSVSLDIVRTKLRELGLPPTGRPKTNASIIAKLRRQPIRLSRMQDVAGCRVVVQDVRIQDEALADVRNAFLTASVVDRRLKPSFGYRAVHIIVRAEDKPVEVQLRTWYQHDWAEISEKLSDKFGLDVKYGGGPYEVHSFLHELSDLTAEIERHQITRDSLANALSNSRRLDQDPREVELVRERISEAARRIAIAEERYEEHVAGFMSDLDIEE